MKKISQYILVSLLGLLLFNSCQQNEYELGDLVVPTNVNVTYHIIGVDELNPYGDGSGMVDFEVTANNAITYNFNFDDGTDVKTAAGGKISKVFSINGVQTYNVQVFAVGTGGTISSVVTPVEVFSNFRDDEALEFLTGGSSKKWYWASDLPGHAGMGPTSDDYGNADFTWPNWWSISPWDSDKACMYSAEFVFTKTDNGLTYEQTTGPGWIPGTWAGDIGVTGDQCIGEDIAPALYGVKNVSFSPSSSNASIVGEYRGTTMTIGEGGFMCWWVGTSEYDIIEVTENILRVRIMEDETQSWYHIFTSVKPVQSK
ncbi:MAG: hypothetical protein K9H64_00420 [Bacteroidales bacterium]|nr:hypothetical protein [Bacteroidales bacterium]MCF8454358.1 hypothetical protein [Bacteroidales bacterium]